MFKCLDSPFSVSTCVNSHTTGKRVVAIVPYLHCTVWKPFCNEGVTTKILPQPTRCYTDSQTLCSQMSV